MAPVRTLLLVALFAIATSSAAQVVAGAEIALDPATAAVPAASPYVGIASNGEDTLAVWIDFRGFPTVTLRAARMRDGVRIDESDLVLAQAGVLYRSIGVASNGEGYLVVATHEDDQTEIIAIEDGRVTGRASTSGLHAASIASNGATYCVLGSGRAHFLDARGTVLAQVDVPSESQSVFAVNGSYWLAVDKITNVETLEIVPLTTTGVGEARLSGIETEAGLLAAGTGDRHALLAWIAEGPALQYVVLDANGDPVRPPAAISFPLPVFWYGPASVAWDGSEFLLAWTSDEAPLRGKVYAVRIGTDGVPRNSEPYLLPGVSGAFASAFDGRDAWIARNENHGAFDALTVSAIGPFAEGTTREGEMVSRYGAPQSARAIAGSGDTKLAVWMDVAGLRGAFVDARGATRHIDIAPAPEHRATPLGGMSAWVAAAGDVFLVAWPDLYKAPGSLGWEPYLFAKRIRKDGTFLDVDPFVIARVGDAVAVTSDGARFLVAVRDPSKVRGFLIPSGASTVQPAFEVNGNNSEFPALLTAEWTGSAYAVSWSEYNPTSHQLIRVNADGQWIGSRVTLTDVVDSSVAIARRDDGAIAVWREGGCLRQRPLLADGQAGGPARTIVCGTTEERWGNIQASWVAGRWVVLWSRFLFTTDPLRGIRLGTDGEPIGEIFTVDVPYARAVHRGAVVSGRSLLLFYDRPAAEPPYEGVRRVFVRPLLVDPEARRGRAMRR